MIEDKEFFPLLFKKIEGIQEKLRPYVEAYHAPPTEPPLFNDKAWGEVMEEIYPTPKLNLQESVSFCGWLLGLSGYVLDLLMEKYNLAMLEAIMMFMEDAIPKVNEEARNDIEVCFFESIINSLGEDERALKEFFELLGPVSIELCKKNDAFWGTQTKGLYT